MARLPQVSTNALPGVRQNIRVNKDMFGGNMAKDLGGVADAAKSIQQGLERKQEKKEAVEVFNAGEELTRQSIRRQADIQDKYKGLDAEKAPQVIEEEYEKVRESMLSGASSERSRELIRQQVERNKTRDLSFATDHSIRQVDQALKEGFVSGMEADRQFAISGKGSEAAIAEAEMQMRKKVMFMADHAGKDQAWIDAELQKNMGIVHTSIMDMHREERPEVAQAYLNKYKDSINPETFARYHADIDKRVTQKTAMAFATQAAKENMPVDEAVAMLEKNIKDPEKLDLAKSKLFGAYADSKRVKAEKTSAMMEEYNKQAYKDGLSSITDRQLDDLAVVDADSAMRYRESRDKYNRIKAAGGDYAPVSDRKIVGDVARGIASGDIRDVSDLVTYRPYLDKGDWNNFISKMDDQTKVTDAKLLHAYKIMMPEKKRNSGKWDTDQWANYYAFEKEAREGVKENSSPEHVHKTAAAWFLKGKIKDSGFVWDDRMTYSEAVTEGVADRFEALEEIPVNAMTLPGLAAEQKTAARKQSQQQYSVGQRVRQGDAVYEYDGQDWNEVQ
jgi:hypothetical protein